MFLISSAAIILFLLLLALQERRSQVTPHPIRRPTTASTAANHTGTVSGLPEVGGRTVLCTVDAEVVVVVVTGVVVVEEGELGKLFTLVKMYGCSWNIRSINEVKSTLGTSHHHAQVGQQQHVEGALWQLSYLTGAFDVISGIGEIVERLLFTHWL